MTLVKQLRTWDEMPNDDDKAFHWLDLKTAEAADEIESLRQQLAAALAAIKIKNHTLEWLSVKSHTRLQRLRATQALAIQPDDSALKVWLGEPVAWMITYDGKCMGFVPTEEANTVAVYSPKGLK